MMRAAKLSDVLDAMVDQTYIRLTERPDEISNQELLAGLKTIQDSLDKHNKQIAGGGNEIQGPLIQVNQQTTEVNVGTEPKALDKESRDRVKAAIMSVLGNLNNPQPEVIDVVDTVQPEEVTQEETEDVR